MILDTNAISEWGKNNQSLLALFPSDRPVYLPVICLGEYRFGMIRSRDRDRLKQWFEALEKAVSVLLIDNGTATRYAEIREELREAGTPIPDNDVWIAALTRQFELPLLSRD